MKSSLISVFIIFVIAFASGCSAEKYGEDPGEPVGAKGDIRGDIARTPNWFTKDAELDGVAGTSADRAYRLSFVKPQVAPVLVAVVDSGVDLSHEDLKDSAWVNLAELNGTKGVDDDSNGYVDDINGWNFLGSYTGDGKPTFVVQETFEVTRESVRMKKLKTEREAQGLTLSADELAYYDKVTKDVDTNYKKRQSSLEDAVAQKAKAAELSSQIVALKGVDFETLLASQVESATTLTDEELRAKSALMAVFKEANLAGVPQMSLRIERRRLALNSYDENFNPRAEIIGDDPSDFIKVGYGNIVIWGPLDEDGVPGEALHGTHVAGIIGAKRTNGIGMDGVARDVRFMALRAVPDGDEADKDIANSIDYAVNNGAKIINMSFGKVYSPYKEQVDAAFARAAEKNVLVIHAAGNDGANNDTRSNFPNRFPKKSPGTTLMHWLEIGASSLEIGTVLPARFSNYGKVSVDLFAPGVNVTATLPGNEYGSLSGTSMAAPATAGVAALVWSQFPTLTAEEVKTLIMESVVTYSSLMVKTPGNGDMVAFSSLSQTGGVANAYFAMKRACEYTHGTNCD